jgi:hypothetical protein
VLGCVGTLGEVYSVRAEGWGVVLSRRSTGEMEEVYKEGTEGGLALYEPLHVTVLVRLPR